MPRTPTHTRLERLDVLVSRLKSDEALTIGGLAEEFCISRRTLARDLDILRERGLPVETDVGRGGGVRLERTWGVGQLRLSYREALELLVSLAVAEQMKAPWLIANLSSIRSKLAASFAPSLRRQVTGLARRIRIGNVASAGVMASFLPPDAKSSEGLFAAFVEMRRLCFRYRDVQGRASQRSVEPHYLLLSYPVWYLVAWDPDRSAARSFRLDRMRGAQAQSEGFSPRPEADFAEAFAGIPSICP